MLLLPLTALVIVNAGCESAGGIAARTREKSAAYAALLPWQQRHVNQGMIATGFTSDMVYMAMGRPNLIETKSAPEGAVERWTYHRYYPSTQAARTFERHRSTDNNPSSLGQTQLAANGKTGQGWLGAGGPEVTSQYPSRGQVPMGMAKGGINQSISKTGPPQGGSMEPDDLRSYRVEVVFLDGAVVQMAATSNIN